MRNPLEEIRGRTRPVSVEPALTPKVNSAAWCFTNPSLIDPGLQIPCHTSRRTVPAGVRTPPKFELDRSATFGVMPNTSMPANFLNFCALWGPCSMTRCLRHPVGTQPSTCYGWLYIAFQSAFETAGRPVSDESLATPPTPVASFCAATLASAA